MPKSSLVRLITLMLLPALLVMGMAQGAYALFECSMSQRVSARCCCAAAPAAQEATSRSDEVTRADCCSERWVEAQAKAQAHEMRSAMPPVLAASYERVLVRDLYASELSPSAFAPREAPRAIGPPLFMLYRVLRL